MNKRFLVCAILVSAVFSSLYGLKQIKDISDAYIFGYPIVLMDMTRKAQLGELGGSKNHQYKTNHFTHLQLFPDHTFRNVVRPNTDTLYSIAWLDLAAEPLVLNLPDMGDRYYIMPLMDAWTNVDTSIGKRLAGTKAADYLISGPAWKGDIPPGLNHIVAATNMNWVVGRIQTNGASDIPVVAKLQQKISLTPLSQWNKGGKPNTNFFISTDAQNRAINPSQYLDDLNAIALFKNLAQLLEHQATQPEDTEMLKLIESLGITTNMEPSIAQRAFLDLAVLLTQSKIKQAIAQRKADKNGWRVIRDSIGEYGTNYRLRAGVARVGLGAIPPAEASYPSTSVDSTGLPLSGRHRYTISFAAGKTPPANAFWSLSMYDKDAFFIPNPINRYSISDRDALVFNADGSLDILIQNSKPERQTVNWLPSPKGKFELTMRIYHPKQEFLSGRWEPPSVERIE